MATTKPLPYGAKVVHTRIVSKCGKFSISTKKQTARASLGTHARFCEICTSPERVKKSKAELESRWAKRKEKAVDEHPAVKNKETVRDVVADPVKPAEAQAPKPTGTVSGGTPIDTTVLDAAFGFNKPGVDTPTPPPEPGEPPKPGEPGEPPTPPPLPSKSGTLFGMELQGELTFSETEWFELCNMLHGAESSIAVMLTKLDEAAMPDEMKAFLSKILAKILFAIWQSIDMSKAMKIMLTLYIIGQVSYLATIGKAVKNKKDDERTEKKAERERRSAED